MCLVFAGGMLLTRKSMLGKRRGDTAKAVHAQRPTTKRRRKGSLSSFYGRCRSVTLLAASNKLDCVKMHAEVLERHAGWISNSPFM